MRFGGVILCGGQSRRMGQSKAHLAFGGETMLSRVARILSLAVDPVVVVAAPGQELPALNPDIPILRDRQTGRGPLEGIAVGLGSLSNRADAAFVTSCDVPLLNVEFIRHMCQLLNSHEVCVPRDKQYHHPLAAVYRTHVRHTIEELLQADRLRPVYLYSQVQTLEVDVEQLRTVDPLLESLDNLNHPEDYARALQRAGLAQRNS